MKLTQIVLIVIGFILLALMATNPSLDEHREEVLDEFKKQYYASKHTSTNSLEAVGEKIGIAFVEKLINTAVKKQNLLLFSFTIVEIDGVKKEIGIGAVGNVWVFKSSNFESFISGLTSEELSELKDNKHKTPTTTPSKTELLINPGFNDFEFINNTSKRIRLAICYPKMSDDWYSFGWIEIIPGDIYKYHSDCASPELYYYAYSDETEFAGNKETNSFAVNFSESAFEYHLTQNPHNVTTKKFVELFTFDNEKWPYQIVFE